MQRNVSFVHKDFEKVARALERAFPRGAIERRIGYSASVKINGHDHLLRVGDDVFKARGVRFLKRFDKVVTVFREVFPEQYGFSQRWELSTPYIKMEASTGKDGKGGLQLRNHEINLRDGKLEAILDSVIPRKYRAWYQSHAETQKVSRFGYEYAQPTD